MKNGSSLILVLLVVAGIMTAIIGVEKVALVQSSQQSSSVDSVYAYNAAKAGIEDGLLRYRFNRNVQTLSDGYRYDLTLGSGPGAENGCELSDPICDVNLVSNHEIYDLNIKYKDTSSHGILGKDKSIEFSGLPGETLQYFLLYNTSSSNTCSNTASPNTFVQIELTDSFGNLIEVHALPSAGQRWITTSPVTVRMTAYNCNVYYNLAPAPGVTDSTIDSQVTTITSTGYYGSAKRTLVATIDRTKDKLIGVYDFAAYAGGNIKQ